MIKIIMIINSFMTVVPIIQKPGHSFAEQITGLVSIYKDLRHERVKKIRQHSIYF